ncbi:hypothetical protein ACFQY8_00025 [Alloscardovia venturai]|uniref:Uncharacterized protein n=1 Tax=Alloscardovia venturai TaxID=1769421 RepID=A0ABW2Y1K4_9BIFI
MIYEFAALCEASGREYKSLNEHLILSLKSSQLAIGIDDGILTAVAVWDKVLPMENYELAEDIVNAWNRDNRILKAYIDEYDISERENIHFYASIEVDVEGQLAETLWRYILEMERFLKFIWTGSLMFSISVELLSFTMILKIYRPRISCLLWMNLTIKPIWSA